MNVLGGGGGGDIARKEKELCPLMQAMTKVSRHPCFEVVHYSLELYSWTHIPPGVAASDILCVADKQLTS